MMDELSEGELLYISDGITCNYRIDGRSTLETREIFVKNHIIPNAYGSSLAQSFGCSIAVGVKVEVGPPTDEEPDCGIVKIGVDCSANASPKFEGRGGEEFAEEIISSLSYAVIPAIDRKQLCIAKKFKVWIIYIDVLILEFSCFSQILDLSSIAVKAALADTRIPKLIVDEEDPNDFVIDNECEYCPVEIEKIPIIISLTKIQNRFIADVTEEEAIKGLATLSLAINQNGELSYIKKSGLGCLDRKHLTSILEDASGMVVAQHFNLYQQILKNKEE